MAAVVSLIITQIYNWLSLLVHNVTCKLLDDFVRLSEQGMKSCGHQLIHNAVLPEHKTSWNGCNPEMDQAKG
jgi:hypothetical protein